MPRYLTERADDRLKRLVEDDNNRKSISEFFKPSPSLAFPRLGRADAAINKFASGTFNLLKNQPDTLIQTTGTVEAFVLCEFAEDDYASLHWHTGESSNGFWLALKCSGAASEDVTCSSCTGGTCPANITVDYNIEHNTQPLLGGLNWATAASGTRVIPMGGCSGTLVLEHGDSTQPFEDDPGSGNTIPAGTPLRSRLVLQAGHPLAGTWGITHYRDYNQGSGWVEYSWIQFGTNTFGSPFDCTATATLNTLITTSPHGDFVDTSTLDITANP